MSTLRIEHTQLELKVIEKYDELIDKIGGVTLYDVEEEECDEDYTDCECITYVNRSGDNVDAKVLQIVKDKGIYIAKDEDDSAKFWIKLSDVSSLYDKISIVEILENILK